jgi:3-oxoacyl-[acyl-carrier protein] reductase
LLHGVFVHAVAPGFAQIERSARRFSGTAGELIRRQNLLNRRLRSEEVVRTVLVLAITEITTDCIVDINGASYLWICGVCTAACRGR